MRSPSLIRQLALLLTIALLFQGYVAVAMPFCLHSASPAAPLVQHSGYHHGESQQAVTPLKLFCDNCKLCSVCSHVYSLPIPILPFPILSATLSYSFLAIFFTSFIPEQLQRPPQFSYLF